MHWKPDINWLSEIDALIGSVPDREVAQLMGVSVYAVTGRKRDLDRARRCENDLAKQSKAANRTQAPRLYDMLGKDSDAAVAFGFGLTEKSVRVQRKKYCIKPKKQKSPRIKRYLSPKEVALFGTMPDRVLAKRLELKPKAVACERERLGIAPFDEKSELLWQKGA